MESVMLVRNYIYGRKFLVNIKCFYLIVFFCVLFIFYYVFIWNKKKKCKIRDYMISLCKNYWLVM